MNKKPLREKKRTYRKSDGDVRCEKCGRYFKSDKAVDDHCKDMHTVEGQERRRRKILRC